MSNRRELLHIPTELLQQIVKYLDLSGLSALRQTCWTTRHLVLPSIFETFRIDFNREDLLRSQIQSLGVEGGISRTAVKAYTRKIRLQAPYAPGTLQYSLSRLKTRASRRKKSLQSDTAFSPAQALSAFQDIEELMTCRVFDCDVRIGACDRIVPVLEYLASLKTLRSLNISLATKMDGLSSEYSPTGPTPPAVTIDSKIENPFVSLLAASPGISKLSIRAWRLDYRNTYLELGWFFKNLSPLSLHSLQLVGLCMDDAGFRSLVPHLGQLRELWFNIADHNASPIWPALETAHIKLQVLHAGRKASPQLLQYLSSFSGLQELTISSQYDFHLSDYITDIAIAIRKHGPTLRKLDLNDGINDQWLYANEIAEALKQCTALQGLVVRIAEFDSVVYFHNLVSDLPSFETLQLDLDMPSGTGGGVRQKLRKQILDFFNLGPSTQEGRLIKVEWYGSVNCCDACAYEFDYLSDQEWSDTSDDSYNDFPDYPTNDDANHGSHDHSDGDSDADEDGDGDPLPNTEKKQASHKIIH
ncbi:hypothetical protein BZA77DRAFT_296733 [Pyronema omphalodes]|nr:hypothetical protein BZA77DRAFT_296733 [Pyronema omphalodes]